MPHPTDKRVGQRIRMARRARNMTQEELAAQIGCKFQQLQKYETATNRVSASRLEMISKALALPIGWFFEEPSADDEAAFADSITLATLHAMTQLPESQRRSILMMVNSMTPNAKEAA